eukprot:m.236544 g.236544  ORF g.236544 m.236544 type:complete len:314 (+) comp12986_c0_seq1:1-942(+)
MAVWILMALAVACQAEMTWPEFKQTYDKSYGSAAEEALRREIFERNTAFVRSHKAETYTVAMNKFGDLSNDEFVSLHAKAPGEKQQYLGPSLGNVSALPASVDWRTSGCVSPVKDQGQCGADWAIVSINLIEAAQCLKHHHTLVPLSLQDVIDCASGSQGCSGGLADTALQYCVEHGIDTEASYPSTGTQGPCKHTEAGVGAKCISWHKITPPGNETDLTAVLAEQGPVACGIDASQSSFQFYSSGVYSDPSCTDQIDHIMLNVGYGATGGKPYYILQNSWGTSWGLNGYMLLARNKGNMCGIASYATYVTVE